MRDYSRAMDKSSEILGHILGDDGEKGYRLLCERTQGYLSIDGQSICDIMSVFLSPIASLLLTLYSVSGKYSQAAIHALAVHIQQTRPRLPTLLSLIYYLTEGEKIARDVGLVTASLDFNSFLSDVKQVMTLDITGAARNACIWDSMEWKWQENISMVADQDGWKEEYS